MPVPVSNVVVPRCVELLAAGADADSDFAADRQPVRLRALAIIANICAANSYIPATEDRHIDAVLHGGGYQVRLPEHGPEPEHEHERHRRSRHRHPLTRERLCRLMRWRSCCS